MGYFHCQEILGSNKGLGWSEALVGLGFGQSGTRKHVALALCHLSGQSIRIGFHSQDRSRPRACRCKSGEQSIWALSRGALSNRLMVFVHRVVSPILFFRCATSDGLNEI
jgi:hypothetical protein